AGAGPRISLTLRDTPLRTALELLFQQSGLQHAVESAVPNLPVTVNLRDTAFASALRVITRLAGVTYRKEGDVYLISLRQPPAVEPTTAEALVPEQPQLPTEPTVEKIPVLFNSAAIFAFAFRGTVLPTEDQVLSGGGLGGGSGTGLTGGLSGAGGGWGIGGGIGGMNGFGGLNGGLGGVGNGLGGLGSGLGNVGGGLGIGGSGNGSYGNVPVFPRRGR
ncbi:MAG TPA: hypothetical protein VGQ24_08840, partial [Gemmatimonadales bacterium]|nr:hypothetical protein [Gemmatimonadales bacterium]